MSSVTGVIVLIGMLKSVTHVDDNCVLCLGQPIICVSMCIHADDIIGIHDMPG